MPPSVYLLLLRIGGGVLEGIRALLTMAPAPVRESIHSSAVNRSKTLIMVVLNSPDPGPGLRSNAGVRPAAGNDCTWLQDRPVPGRRVSFKRNSTTY